MTPIKDVSINGNAYQICAFDAQTGSKLLMKLMATFQKLIQNETGVGSSPDQSSGAVGDEETLSTKLIQYLLMNLPDEEFDKVQRAALSVVNRYVTGGQGTTVPMPIMVSQTAFGFDDLKTDIGSVIQLTSASLFANLSPFFSKDGLKAVMMVS